MTPAAEGITAAKRDDEIRDASAETLRKWHSNNVSLLDEYDPAKEAAEIQLCKMFIRDIRAELVSRAEK